MSLILGGYLDPRLRRSCRGSWPLDLSLPTLPTLREREARMCPTLREREARMWLIS